MIYVEISDNLLRPQKLDDFIGQESIKQKLNIYIKSANIRHEVLDHILLCGPSGLGKTTLANIIANEMHANIIVINAAIIERPTEIINALVSLKPGDILFIDEIHRLPLFIQEVLYSAMEDYFLEVNRFETDSKPIHVDLAPFTLIGATTKYGLLSKPLQNRFAITEHLLPYTIKESEIIVKRLCTIYSLTIDNVGINLIAKSTRGIPRIITNVFKRIRDFALVENIKSLKGNTIKQYLTVLGIDKIGLTKLEYDYLKVLYPKEICRPVGLETIATLLDEDSSTIEEVVESYLLKLGFIEKTKQGRIITSLGIDYLKINSNFSQ